MRETMNIEAADCAQEEKGASMLEYALLAALIAVVALAAVTFLGTQASTTFSIAGESLETAP